MKHKVFFPSIMFALILFLAGCAPGAGGPGPRTWIDAPLDGSTLELAPVVVRSHAASEGGTAQAVLMVNGAQVRVDQAGDSASPLIEFVQTWTPDGPGVYVLQVISRDQAGHEGRSNTVRVQVGEVPIGETITPSPETATATDLSTTPTFTFTPVLTATATTVTEPTFTFSTGANCRKGDSTAYDVVTSFLQGDQVRIDGRNSNSSWFRVLIPSGGNCWVAGSTGTPTGPYDSVQVVLPPPLPATATDTPSPQPQVQPPAAPGNLQIAAEVCSANEYKVTLQWTNVDGEDGYRVYRDEVLVASLGPDVTSFMDSPPNYNAHSYAVEAFNGAGSSARLTIQEDGCLF